MPFETRTDRAVSGANVEPDSMTRQLHDIAFKSIYGSEFNYPPTYYGNTTEILAKQHFEELKNADGNHPSEKAKSTVVRSSNNENNHTELFFGATAGGSISSLTSAMDKRNLTETLGKQEFEKLNKAHGSNPFEKVSLKNTGLCIGGAASGAAISSYTWAMDKKYIASSPEMRTELAGWEAQSKALKRLRPHFESINYLQEECIRTDKALFLYKNGISENPLHQYFLNEFGPNDLQLEIYRRGSLDLSTKLATAKSVFAREAELGVGSLFKRQLCGAGRGLLFAAGVMAVGYCFEQIQKGKLFPFQKTANGSH